MTKSSVRQLTIGQCATMACLLESTVPKPGNVHRGADFEDVTFLDFAMSAAAIGPSMEDARQAGVGATVLGAIRATRDLVATNTNLGTVLLLAPLAAIDREQSIREGIGTVLQDLSPSDAASIYEAIRVAHPGGMGEVAEMDVGDQPPDCLMEAMRAAAGRDLVARQYANGFGNLLDEVTPALLAGPGRGWSVTDTIIQTQLLMMSRYPDSLIFRKCGVGVARESAARAAHVLESGAPGSDAYLDALSGFDFWLRSDRHRRNPGTTADLIAAGLFIALREGTLAPPFR